MVLTRVGALTLSQGCRMHGDWPTCERCGADTHFAGYVSAFAGKPQVNFYRCGNCSWLFAQDAPEPAASQLPPREPAQPDQPVVQQQQQIQPKDEE